MCGRGSFLNISVEIAGLELSLHLRADDLHGPAGYLSEELLLLAMLPAFPVMSICSEELPGLPQVF